MNIDCIALAAENFPENKILLAEKASNLTSVSYESLESITDMKIFKWLRDNDSWEQLWDLIYELFAWLYLLQNSLGNRVLFLPTSKNPTPDIQVWEKYYEVKRIRKSVQWEAKEFLNLKNRTSMGYFRSPNTVDIEQQDNNILRDKILETIKKAIIKKPENVSDSNFFIILYVDLDLTKVRIIDLNIIFSEVQKQTNKNIILGECRGSKIKYFNFFN